MIDEELVRDKTIKIGIDCQEVKCQHRRIIIYLGDLQNSPTRRTPVEKWNCYVSDNKRYDRWRGPTNDQVEFTHLDN